MVFDYDKMYEESLTLCSFIFFKTVHAEKMSLFIIYLANPPGKLRCSTQLIITFASLITNCVLHRNLPLPTLAVLSSGLNINKLYSRAEFFSDCGSSNNKTTSKETEWGFGLVVKHVVWEPRFGLIIPCYKYVIHTRLSVRYSCFQKYAST